VIQPNILFLQVLRYNLESLGVLHAGLQAVPQRALNGLALRVLNLEGNAISELPSYTFYGLHLMKVRRSVLIFLYEYDVILIFDTV
jgi:hypothetical protein